MTHSRTHMYVSTLFSVYVYVYILLFVERCSCQLCTSSFLCATLLYRNEGGGDNNEEMGQQEQEHIIGDGPLCLVSIYIPQKF